MNRKLANRAAWLVVGVVALFATGCAATGTNLVAAGTVSSVKSQAADAVFYDVKALQVTNDLVVSGAIKTTTPFTTPPTGHVDVAVLDAQGAVLAKASYLVRHWVLLTKASQLSSSRPPRFTFSFPMTPTTGTQVRLALHKDTPFSWSNLFDCGDNRAAAQVSRRGDPQ